MGPWIALGAAFSPVLVDLARNLAADPRDLYTLLSPLLIGLVLVRGAGRRERGRFRGGLPLVGLGLALEVLGIVAASWSIARLGLPVAAFGLARATGCSGRVAALSFAAIPLPAFVLATGSPRIEGGLAEIGTSLLAGAGLALSARGPLVCHGADCLELLSSDAGLVTAVMLAQLGWYSALREAGDLPEAALRAVRWLPWVLVVQPVAVLIALLATAVGLPDLGRAWLSYGVVALLAAGGIYAVERTQRTPRSASER